MLVIRLHRVGKKNSPAYRLVVIRKSAAPKSGNFLEVLGSYNRIGGKINSNLKKDRIEYWLSKGAQASDTVHNILVNEGIIKGSKIKKRIKSKPQEESESQKEESGKAEEPKLDEKKESSDSSEKKQEDNKEEKSEEPKDSASDSEQKEDKTSSEATSDNQENK